MRQGKRCFGDQLTAIRTPENRTTEISSIHFPILTAKRRIIRWYIHGCDNGVNINPEHSDRALHHSGEFIIFSTYASDPNTGTSVVLVKFRILRWRAGSHGNIIGFTVGLAAT